MSLAPGVVQGLTVLRTGNCLSDSCPITTFGDARGNCIEKRKYESSPSFVFSFFLAVAQAPLKPKTPRGTKTPINRNQLTQNRGLGGIMVKRAYETVS